MVAYSINRLFRACLFFSIIAAVASTALATEIRLVVNDGPNEGFNDNGPAMANQTGNNGSTLGEQRLAVFQAAADYWEARLVSDVPVLVEINFDPLFCSARSATLGSAGPRGIFRDFPNAPLPNTWYVAAVADSLSGSDQSPGRADIGATFNSDIDNNSNCLGNTNWWLGINSPAPSRTISLFDTVLHEIGHGLGVTSLVSQSGRLNGGRNDAYSNNLFDETANQFWSNMSDAQRAASAINTGNVTWRGANADNNSDHVVAGKTNGHLRMFAPNPYQGGSSISHWDTALSPDELMEPSATATSDDRSTLQLLKDVGWRIVEDSTPPPPPPPLVAGTIGLRVANVSVVENAGPAVIQLERTGGRDGAVSVLIRSAGVSATFNSDYTAINQRVNWGDGETGIRTVNVTVVDDGIAEGNGETVSLLLSNVTGGATLARTLTTLTILDPPTTPSPGTIGFISAGLNVSEDDGVATITVRRTGGSDGAASIFLNSADISATAGLDYRSITNQVINWSNGQAGNRTFSLTILNDNISEPNDEQVLLTLSNASNGVAIDRASTLLTIRDVATVTPTPTPTPTPGDDDGDFLLGLIPAIISGSNQARLKKAPVLVD